MTDAHDPSTFTEEVPEDGCRIFGPSPDFVSSQFMDLSRDPVRGPSLVTPDLRESGSRTGRTRTHRHPPVHLDGPPRRVRTGRRPPLHEEPGDEISCDGPSHTPGRHDPSPTGPVPVGSGGPGSFLDTDEWGEDRGVGVWV